MSENTPRRLRRFERRKKQDQNDVPAWQTDAPDRTSRMSEELTDQASQNTPHVRYWNQSKAGLDEISGSLFEQLKDTGEKESGLDSSQHKPNTHESLLEQRRRHRSSRQAQPTDAPAKPNPSDTASEQTASSAPASGASAQRIKGMDVSRLFGDKASAPKAEDDLKDLAKELGHISDADSRKSGENDMETLDFGALEEMDPALEKLRRKIQKKEK